MGDYENFINEAVDDDKEATFSNVDKMQAFMVEQGSKSALSRYIENPSFTSEGQLVVAQSENFWSRLAKEGRWRCDASINETPFSANALKFVQNTFKPSLGCVLYPKRIDFSVTQDALFYLYVYTGFSDADDAQYYGYIKAYTPFIAEFDGDVCMQEGGSVELRILSTSAGKICMTSNGIEVSKNA